MGTCGGCVIFRMWIPCGSRILPRLPGAPLFPSSRPLFDVEQFRTLDSRRAAAPLVRHPTVVLGSAQRAGILKQERVAEIGAEVVHRRGGGGAVLLHPGDHLWIDAWIPRDDPLWDPDVSVAAAWVGAWWRAALE